MIWPQTRIAAFNCRQSSSLQVLLFPYVESSLRLELEKTLQPLSQLLYLQIPFLSRQHHFYCQNDCVVKLTMILLHLRGTSARIVDSHRLSEYQHRWHCPHLHRSRQVLLLQKCLQAEDRAVAPRTSRHLLYLL